MADDAAEVPMDEVNILDVSPARDLNPVQFLGPHGTSPAERDFRPTPFVFKNDEPQKKDEDEDDDDIIEDGHGNMRAKPREIRHPSVPSPERQRLLERMNPERAQETLDFDNTPPAPDPEKPQTDSPKEPQQAPGITGSKQDQSSEE